VRRPKLLYLPTASADSPAGIIGWYKSCAPLEVYPLVQDSFIASARQKQSWEEVLLSGGLGAALLRGDGGVHPPVLHHAMRRTKTEIVHMIGNVEPAVDDARRNDKHVTDLQLDFA
jgi:hypothetical protein